MRHLTKLRWTKFFRDKSEPLKLMEDLRQGVPLNAGRLEMKKADKHLKQWGSSLKQEIGAEFR